MELVERAQRRDAQAFAKVIARLERTALAVAFGVLRDGGDAGDVVQEAFFKAWQRLGDLKDPAAFVPWLCGIVRNLAIDAGRRARPMADLEASPEPMDSNSDADPIQKITRDEERTQMQQALDSLDPTSGTAVVLRYYENLSSKEIEQILGLAPAAVDMRLMRARQQLREIFSPAMQD